MKAVTLTQPEQIAFSESALTLRYPLNDVGESTAPFDASKMLQPKRFYYGEDKEPTLWNTFNNVQENFLKGGIVSYNNESGRRNRTRAIKSVNADVKVNQALWVLAERMQEIKAAQ